MVDVKTHYCFPTMVTEFSYHSDDWDKKQMISYIKNAEKNDDGSSGFTVHTNDNLHSLSYFAKLRNAVLEANKNYAEKMNFIYDYCTPLDKYILNSLRKLLLFIFLTQGHKQIFLNQELLN